MCEACDWEDFADGLQVILGDPDFAWAADTIEGIQETVREKEHVTERQKEAIENIEAAVERRR
jgi:hypothetical protein